MANLPLRNGRFLKGRFLKGPGGGAGNLYTRTSGFCIGHTGEIIIETIINKLMMYWGPKQLGFGKVHLAKYSLAL